MSFRSACVVALSALTATSLAAQQPTADATRALAIAFARATNPVDSTSTVDVVDAVPADYQSLIHLPADARVVATVTTGRGATVLATSPQPTDTVLQQIAREYGRAGWAGVSTITLPQTASPMLGGFRPSPSAVPRQFCQSGTEVLPVVNRAGDGLTLVQLRIIRGSVPCSRVPATRPTTASAQPRLPLPLLRDPQDATMRAECFLIGSSQRTQTQLSTAMEPAALLDHYGKQLDAQGWTRMPETAAVRGNWSRRDSTGVLEVATLSIATRPTAAGCRDAQIEVTTIRSR